MSLRKKEAKRKALAQTWTATVLTLLPDMFPGPLGLSLAGRALQDGRWSLKTVDIREYATDTHRSVDDSPAGGGAGMVMRADVAAKAVDAHWSEDRPLLYMSPRGAPLTQGDVRSLANGPGPVVLCGRFEGVDERLLQARPFREVSIGDYVLSGGDLAAMVLIDAVVRILPGVVGDEASLAEESFETGLLEYPHYTRPQTWEGRDIPEVLLSGHHGRIKAWRQAQAEEITKGRRPDLWKQYVEVNNKIGKKDNEL